MPGHYHRTSPDSTMGRSTSRKQISSRAPRSPIAEKLKTSLTRSLTPVSKAGSELRSRVKKGAKQVATKLVDPTGKHARQEKRNQQPLTKAEVAAHAKKMKARWAAKKKK